MGCQSKSFLLSKGGESDGKINKGCKEDVETSLHGAGGIGGVFGTSDSGRTSGVAGITICPIYTTCFWALIHRKISVTAAAIGGYRDSGGYNGRAILEF